MSGIDAITLELFRYRFTAIAEEMGDVLTRAALSPNIRERRDHSCALFDASGDMIAQAAHIPVHLGAAPACVRAVLAALDLADGETAIVNDPFAGGTHLPDVTLVTAVDIGGARMFVATRAHHADVGGISPGSLPLSKTIDDEGWRCPPVRAEEPVFASLIAASRTPDERRGDLAAQRAANRVGVARLRALADMHGARTCHEAAQALLDHAGRLGAAWLEAADLRVGAVEVEDWLDDARGDGPSVPIRLVLSHADGRLRFDFSDSADQVEGPLNAVRSIVESAVFYALACVVGRDAPANSGLVRIAEIVTRAGSVVDARPPAAVSAGNVETSQRLVDVIFEALRQLGAAGIPAASHGSMNNVLIGSVSGAERPFVYYETIGGGIGASPAGPGASATHAHMTNTLNTPVEALERAFPLRVVRYAIRAESGGAGRYRGGDGIVRVFEATADVEATVIGDRRRFAPPGAAGGEDGAPGRQWIERRDGAIEPLPGKATRLLRPGDRLVVETPGGGGWGAADDSTALPGSGGARR